MERQAAYDLFKCFLEKRQVKLDFKKDLPRLLEYGKEKGFFANTQEVFKIEEWRNLGDCLYRAVIDEDKIAKKLSQPWQVVIHCLEANQAEKKIAAVASIHLDGKLSAVPQTTAQTTAQSKSSIIQPGMYVFGGDNLPQAPAAKQLTIPLKAASEEKTMTSAPPIQQDDLSLGGEAELEREAAQSHTDDNMALKSTCINKGLTDWNQIKREALAAEDLDFVVNLQKPQVLKQAFPVTYTPDATGGLLEANITALD